MSAAFPARTGTPVIVFPSASVVEKRPTSIFTISVRKNACPSDRGVHLKHRGMRLQIGSRQSRLDPNNVRQRDIDPADGTTPPHRYARRVLASRLFIIGCVRRVKVSLSLGRTGVIAVATTGSSSPAPAAGSPVCASKSGGVTQFPLMAVVLLPAARNAVSRPRRRRDIAPLELRQRRAAS